MKTHRETYPEQYTHPLCGKKVIVRHEGRVVAQGTVDRVVQTRFGPLAHLDGSVDVAYAVSGCEVQQ